MLKTNSHYVLQTHQSNEPKLQIINHQMQWSWQHDPRPSTTCQLNHNSANSFQVSWIITPLTDNTEVHRCHDWLSCVRGHTWVRPRILWKDITYNQPAHSTHTRLYDVVGWRSEFHILAEPLDAVGQLIDWQTTFQCDFLTLSHVLISQRLSTHTGQLLIHAMTLTNQVYLLTAALRSLHDI